jgi:hypothetical protein
MFPMAKLLQVGVAGLTALMTFVAEMPRLDCICPNGNVKILCLKTLVGADGCCCDGTCCDKPSVSTRLAPRKSCCHCEHQPAPGSDKSPSAKPNPCRQTLTAAEPSVIASSPDAPRQADIANMAFLPIPIPPAAGVDSFRLTFGSPPQPLPPTDLLATCKHLLI